MGHVHHNLKVGLDEELQEKIALLSPDFVSYRVLRESVDARRRHEIHKVYSVEIFGPGEAPEPFQVHLDQVRNLGARPVIIGMGPAGIFAALRLCERGIPSLLLERGSQAEKRVLHINRFWRYGELHPENNVCFGEGGAGLFSDGKLITRIKSPHIPYVLDRLIQFGAPEEIRYLANPHVGSDRLRRVIPKIRDFLVQKGVEVRFDTRVEELLTDGPRVVGARTHTGETFHSDHVVLATGHSAGDIFSALEKAQVSMEGKSFAVGLRIEHPQKWIDQIQYRKFAGHPKLGAANYKLACHDEKTGIGVYSFCMCPGGYVLSSGTETDGIVSNGMSNFHRNSPFANAALVVSVDHVARFGSSLFGGLHFRRHLEQEAFQAVQKAGGSKQLPAQTVSDFLSRKLGESLPTSSPSGVLAARLDQILPKDICEKLREGLEDFEKKMPGFMGPEAQLIGVETRTSCPIRVTRDAETLQSLSHSGLYPTGEGAGYAGGITSAAVDGVCVAEAIARSLSSRILTDSSSRDFSPG